MFDYFSNPESFKETSGYTIDGTWYPRVTRIVSIKAKPALLRFYAEQPSFKASQAITEKSAEEGTLVHEVAQAFLLGQKPEIPESIAPSINAFLEFIDKNSIHTTAESIERRIVNYGHRYAGTIDGMALIGGKFGVMDIKTSQAIYRDYNLQTAAYMDALKDEFPNLQTRWILRIDQIQRCTNCRATRRVKGGREKIKLNGGGSGCVHEWGDMEGQVELKEFPHWQSDFEAFLGAKKLWEWENEYWLKKIGYL